MPAHLLRAPARARARARRTRRSPRPPQAARGADGRGRGRARRRRRTARAAPRDGGAAGGGAAGGGAADGAGDAGAKADADADAEELIERSRELLHAVCELSQKSVAQLLILRKEVHVQLSLRDLKNLWDSTLEFLQAVEGLSGTTGYGLRSCLLQQAKAFLEHKHEAQLARLVATLDSEKWAHAHVSAERQSALDKLSTGRAFLPEELTRAIDHVRSAAARARARRRARRRRRRTTRSSTAPRSRSCGARCCWSRW